MVYRDKQHVTPKKRPLISELDESSGYVDGNVYMQSDLKLLLDRSTAEKPLYKIIREPPEGDAEYLIMELQLPKLVCFVLLWLCNASSIASNSFSLKIIFAALSKKFYC